MTPGMVFAVDDGIMLEGSVKRIVLLVEHGTTARQSNRDVHYRDIAALTSTCEVCCMREGKITVTICPIGVLALVGSTAATSWSLPAKNIPTGHSFCSQRRRGIRDKGLSQL